MSYMTQISVAQTFFYQYKKKFGLFSIWLLISWLGLNESWMNLQPTAHSFIESQPTLPVSVYIPTTCSEQS